MPILGLSQRLTVAADRAWPTFLTVAVALFGLMATIEPGLGIAELQLAGSAQNAAEVIAGYGDTDSARAQVLVDFVFIPLLALGLAGLVRRVLTDGLALRSATTLVVLYAAADAAEDAGLLVMLAHPSAITTLEAVGTTAAAAVKFVSLAGVIVLAAVGLVRRARS